MKLAAGKLGAGKLGALGKIRLRAAHPAAADPAAPVEPAAQPGSPVTKGRPTPKRRTASAPVLAPPRTRKEAVAWQKQRTKAEAAAKPAMSGAQMRQAMRDGDARYLPKRDQGPVRALARDFVDSRRMLSNYLLLLLPFMFAGLIFKQLEVITLVLFMVLAVEWLLAGRKIRQLAASRGLSSRDTTVGLGLYAGGRAYFRRSWRRPAPRVGLGDTI